MNKMKIAGIIISIVAAVAFVLLYFGRPHTVINAILVLLAGGVAVLGLMMVSVVEEINLEDTKLFTDSSNSYSLLALRPVL